VNKVTPELFLRYPTPELMAQAPLEELEGLISSLNFFRNKAKNMKACALALVQKYEGSVPGQMEQLIELAGVGRKTANCILGDIFKAPVGIVVDTHVARISGRLGWTREQTPVLIEKDLMTKIPHEDWALVAHLLIFHGRRLCQARSPDCNSCFLFDLCPRRGVK